jgi:phage FluMu protein gp41
MLEHEYYVRQKLRELEQDQLLAQMTAARLKVAKGGPPLVSPVVRGTGRLLRRLGEGLEGWAGHEPEPMRLGREPR